MNYHVVTRWGGSEDQPNEHRIREILAELEKSDPEHPDTWLTHENGWTLSIYESVYYQKTRLTLKMVVHAASR